MKLLAPVHISTERVPNENIWPWQTCGIQQRVQLLRDLPGQEFATYGRSFLTLALHQAMHRGNATDARRAVGRAALAARAAI
jgi:hypothetical protein